MSFKKESQPFQGLAISLDYEKNLRM